MLTFDTWKNTKKVHGVDREITFPKAMSNGNQGDGRLGAGDKAN